MMLPPPAAMTARPLSVAAQQRRHPWAARVAHHLQKDPLLVVLLELLLLLPPLWPVVHRSALRWSSNRALPNHPLPVWAPTAPSAPHHLPK